MNLPPTSMRSTYLPLSQRASPNTFSSFSSNSTSKWGNHIFMISEQNDNSSNDSVHTLGALLALKHLKPSSGIELITILCMPLLTYHKAIRATFANGYFFCLSFLLGMGKREHFPKVMYGGPGTELVTTRFMQLLSYHQAMGATSLLHIFFNNYFSAFEWKRECAFQNK